MDSGNKLQRQKKDPWSLGGEQRHVPWRKEGREKAQMCSKDRQLPEERRHKCVCVCVCVCVWERERERDSVSLFLRGFICSLKVGTSGEVLEEDLNRLFISFLSIPLRVLVSIDWSALGQGVISHCSWSWCQACCCFIWFWYFSGLGAKTQLRPRCYP